MSETKAAKRPYRVTVMREATVWVLAESKGQAEAWAEDNESDVLAYADVVAYASEETNKLHEELENDDRTVAEFLRGDPPKADQEAARKAVERMEQERVMVHGIEVKPGQAWEYEPHEGLPSRVANIRDGAILCRDGLDWEPSVFATWHKRLAQPTQPDEAPRWTDAEWAAEAVARAQRQADAARAEARELRVEFEDRRDRLRSIAQAVIEEIGSDGPQSAQPAVERLLVKYREAVAQLAEARAALEAARAAHPAQPPGGSDPATRNRALPVVPGAVPEMCGECSHSRGRGEFGTCQHPTALARRGENTGVRMLKAPEAWCPIRAELAKAGGL